MKLVLTALLTIALANSSISATQEVTADLPPAFAGVGFDQRLGAQVPTDLHFTNAEGEAVVLDDYFGSKPVILVLAYYRCPRLCTMVLNGLVQGMLEMDVKPGQDYEVITVSFDPREDSELAAQKKETYLKRLGQPAAEHAWHFLTGDEDQIRRLADAVGFQYRFDPELNQYIHASGIMVLTPGGAVSRYFYDVQYPGRDLQLGLVEASSNEIGTPVDQVLLYCFQYNPAAGKYSANVMNLIRASGIAIMCTIAVFVVMLRHSARNREAIVKESSG